MKRTFKLSAIVATAVMMVAGAAYADNCNKTEAASTCSKPKSIVDTASAAGSFNTLLAAAKAAGLADTLAGDGEFTVFAPTDEAFAALPEGTVEGLLENPDALRTVLLYHVVSGSVPASQVVGMETAPTLSGQSLSVDTTDGVMIDNAKVVKADIECSNGVIHVIDSVMLPGDIVDVASSTGTFSTLVAAVEAAELVDTLKGDGPFTVFAPTDDAFEKLPEGTVDSLLMPENRDKLVSILTYHVVPGHVTASEVIGLDSATTAQGGELEIQTKRADDGSIEAVHVAGAQVVQTDILGSNGVIHVVDSVMIP